MIAFVTTFGLATQVQANGTAQLQIIHNSADPAAAEVDIYVNGSLEFDDFAFRTATPYLELPAGVNLDVAVAPPTSISAAEALAVFPLILKAGRTYVAIANGVLDPSQFTENPSHKPTGFDLYINDHMRTEAYLKYFVEVRVFHGATDAPGVDALVNGWRWGKLVDDLEYGDFSSYRRLLPREQTITITPANDNEVEVAKFDIDLSGLRGGTAVVFASGFLAPGENNSGAPFGLFAALPDGQVVEFKQVEQTAELQVIHNAADPAADVVDIYVNGNLFKDDFAFRTATEFLEVPAGVTLNIGVAPGNSSSASDVIATIPVTLESQKRYVAVANGVLDPSSFAANPDARPIGFNLYAADGIKTEAKWPFTVNFVVFHGATDAPAVDVLVRNLNSYALVQNLGYGEFTEYKTVFASDYVLDVTPAGMNNTVVASFDASLSGLGGGAAVVFASGFLNPSASQNGEAFGLFAALPNGTVIELPQLDQTARLQVIHNAADPDAEVVDIYVNGNLFQDNFEFRTATPFVDVPSGVELNIAVAPGNSGSVADAIATFPVTLEAQKTYVAIANGVLSPGDFANNPSGEETAFNIYAIDGIKEEAEWGPFVSLIAFHGATDAPAVDILVRAGFFKFKLFSDLTYGGFSHYRTVWPADYKLYVTPAGDNSTIVAEYSAELSALKGEAAVVFASGFLSPEDDQNGPAFGLYAALPDGTVIELPAASGGPFAKLNSDDPIRPESFELRQNYPNPFNPTTRISFSLAKAGEVELKVYNVLGQEVETLVDDYYDAGDHEVLFDASNMASGVYFYKVNAGDYSDVKKMTLLK